MLVMRGGHRFPWPVIWALALAAGSAACASTGAVPKPFPMPGGSAPAPAAPTDAASAPGPRPAPAPPRGPRSAIDGYALVGTALALRGTPYRDGGTDLSGFDCSGFTQYVFAQHGVALPREVRDQFRVANR